MEQARPSSVMDRLARRVAAAPPAAPAKIRLPVLDAMRLLAAVAIVWLHTVSSPRLAHTVDPLTRFAVPFFTAGAVFLLMENLRRQPRRGWGSYAASRFRRLYLPFLLWSAAYFALRQAKHRLLSHEPPLPVGSYLLWAGSAHHLWFLPFLLVLSVALFPVAKAVAGRRGVGWLVALLAAAGGAAVALVPPPVPASTLAPTDAEMARYVARLSWAALPAGLWAVAFAVVYARTGPRHWRSGLVAVAAALLAAGCCVTIWRTGRNAALENAAGLACLVVGLAPWDGRLVRGLAALGTLAYGVYLSHVLFVEGIQAVAARAGVAAGNSWWSDVAVFAGAVAGSLVLSAYLRRSRWTRPLVA
jgi:peptidoglycan/LPS O-acetylase OafA/YrhL